jgi:hypothetical protein
MPASRVESESKPEPKRWETLGDEYKADLTAHPEEIKDLCPIVITTIAAAPTQNKGDDTGDGADILSICGKKVHVLWNWWDMALLGRRALNSGRRALGKVGDEGKQGDGKLIADASKLVYRESNDLNKQVEGFVNRRTGHGYQAVDGALDYYLAEL